MTKKLISVAAVATVASVLWAPIGWADDPNDPPSHCYLEKTSLHKAATESGVSFGEWLGGLIDGILGSEGDLGTNRDRDSDGSNGKDADS